MSKLLYPLFNSLTLIFTLAINYWVNSGMYHGETIGSISNQYDSLITPAGYAFSIWGLIYLLLVGFISYQWYHYFTGKGYDPQKSGLWPAVVNVLNGVWVLVWLSEYAWLSVIVMILLLLSLVRVVIRLDMERWDASLEVLAFVWWPIALYLGWILLALVVNIAAFLIKMDWIFLFSETYWAILVLFMVTAIYLYLIRTRFLRESAVAGMWGLMAIFLKQREIIPEVGYVALGCMIILGIAVGIQAFQNRKTLPWLRKLYE